MAAFEVLALDPTTPQIRAPGAADTYSFPRAITPSGANVTPITVSGYSLTGANAQSMFDLSGTWNTTGTPTALKLNVTDTASNAASLLMDLQVGGSTRFNVRKDGTVNLSTNAPYINVPSGFAALQFSGANVLVWQSGAVRVNGVDLQIGSTDTILTRDAANTLAQRNGTNAQTFNIYNTFTDASNYERVTFSWVSNELRIRTEKAGTGLDRALNISPLSNLFIGSQNGDTYITGGGSNRWRFQNAGNFIADSDNTVDIGASGANRPRTVYAGTSVLAPYVRTSTAYTVATLPAAGTAGAGARAYVTDANATTFASIVAGGGANIVPVMSNGTNWIIG